MQTQQPGEEGNFRQSNLNNDTGHTSMTGHDRTLERLYEQLCHAKRVVAQTRAMIQARHGAHQEGTLSMDPHTFNERQAQDKDDLKQAEGVVTGLNVAVAVGEAKAEEAGDPTASLRPGPA